MKGFKQHALLPTPQHDEQARQDFVGALRGHLSGRVMPGNYQLFERRVAPRFAAEHGRPPGEEQEIRD